MTDTEIKKALEWCERFTDNLVMANIDTKKRTLGLQAMQTCKKALDLINRQKAEIERLKDALTDHEYANCVAIKNGLIYTHTLEDYDRLIGDISAESYKEFAERLKKALYSDSCRLVFDSDLDIFECAIDNLLKELVGEDK